MNLPGILALLFLLFSPALAAAEDKPEPLLIQGQNFAVSVMEPEGWLADSTAHASEHEHLVLTKVRKDALAGRPTMRVLVAVKMDESTEEDLKFDMETYRKKHPAVQFKDIVVRHPEYRTFPKLFSVEGSFSEYVTYLNPGRKYPYIITASLTVPGAAATDEDLQAYAALVASIKAVK